MHSIENQKTIECRNEKKMADISNAVKSGVSTAFAQIKTYVLPMCIGAIVIALIVGFLPATKKFLQ